MATYSKVTGVTTNLSVRDKADASGALLFSLYPDEVVQVLSGPSNGWTKIRHKRGDGYASSSFLTYPSTVTGTLATIINVSQSVNARTGPYSNNDTKYPVYFTIPLNATVRVLETFLTWKIVEYNSKVACVHPSYVSGSSTEGPSQVALNGAQVISGGCNCYDMKGTAYTFVTHASGLSINVLDEGDFSWLVHNCSIGAASGQTIRRFIQRKNIDTSYCNISSRATVFGSSMLQSGTSTSYVFNLQFYLRYWYSSVPISGTVCATTLKYIKYFQQAVGLYADGIVGNDTKDALIFYRRKALP